MSPVESFYLSAGVMLGLIVGCGIGAFVFWMTTRLEQQEVDDVLEQCNSLQSKLRTYYDAAKEARWERRKLEWYERLNDSELRKIKNQIDFLYQKINEK